MSTRSNDKFGRAAKQAESCQFLLDEAIISWKSNISFKGLFAGNNTNAPWDNGSATGGSDPVGPTGLNDYILLEYAIIKNLSIK